MKTFAVSLIAVFGLLQVAKADNFADGEFVAQVRGRCGSECRKELKSALEAKGMTSCSIKKNAARIYSKSFVFVRCEATGATSAAAASAVAQEIGAAFSSCKNVRIDQVEADMEMQTAQAPPRGSLWGLDEVDGKKDNRRCLNSKLGRGVDIFILDTGCNASRGGMCTSDVTGESTCSDKNGHGIHVAGTATSSRYGVAPRARRHCLKVLGASGNGPLSNIIKAIARVVKFRKGSRRPGVINISIRGPRNSAVNAAVNAASGRGLYFSIAAGNDRENACTKSPASASPGDRYAFTVAAHDVKGVRYSSTNFGSCVDLSAPGVRILSDGGYKTGTSMAAPHVAGAIANLLSDRKRVSLGSLVARRIVKGLKKKALQIKC